MQITVTLSADQATRRLVKFARAMEPRQRAEANQKAATQMHSYVMRIFEAEGAYDGRPAWAPLKAGGRWLTVQRRDGSRSRKRFQADARVLQDTGALRQSYFPLHTHEIAGVGAISMRRHADLAPIHQFGNPSRNLPARPMLPDNRAALGIVTDIYKYELQRAANP